MRENSLITILCTIAALCSILVFSMGCSYNSIKGPDDSKESAMQDGKIVMPGGAQARGKISDEMKKRIDSWITENGLNEYGDPKTTMYLGGTPLFNESSGVTRDRYEDILENHPALGRP